MNKIPNKENIKLIQMHPKATCFCNIGQDWYLNEFTIHFYPGAFYPDYMEVESWINKNIEGQNLNIEEAINKIYNFLKLYEPDGLEVISNVNDCKTHFNVMVKK